MSTLSLVKFFFYTYCKRSDCFGILSAQLNSDLTSVINNTMIKSYDVSPTIWERKDYPRAIHNWKSDPIFPATYGSGYIIPTPDTAFSFIIYTTGSLLWCKKIYHTDIRIEWSEK